MHAPGGAWAVCPAHDRHPHAGYLSLTKDRHSHVKDPSATFTSTATTKPRLDLTSLEPCQDDS